VTDLKRGDAVTHPHFRGIALRVVQVHGNRESTVDVRMVGDDQLHLVSTEDLTALDEDAYCGGCGQIGCAWG
jgi:hypothetical protein